MRQPPPPVFSRRSFIFFVLLAPAGLLTIAGIVLVLQYTQFRAMVSPAPVVEEFVWTDGDRHRFDSLAASFGRFASGGGSDSLLLSAPDLTLLAAGSPVPNRQRIRFRFHSADSLLLVESTQRVEAMNGRFAWIFKRFAPAGGGWLNARVEGLPEWKSGNLALAPARGFLNGTKVPRTALTKRGGMSPKDFLDPVVAPEYNAFLAALDTVLLDSDGIVLLVRKR